jgi:glycosyltransferase involved in cell wall biosynthesis
VSGPQIRIAPQTRGGTSAASPLVTVAISTRNRGRLIKETLEALLAVHQPGVEILVADQSTDDRTLEAVEEVAAGDPRVRYERSSQVGLSRGRNFALHSSHAEVIAYTDDDCIVTPEWLPTIMKEFADPEIAAVYGRLLPYEGTDRTGIEVGFKPSLVRSEYRVRTPGWYIGHGGNMAFRRSALLEVGGFDPLLSAGAELASGEDSDIAHRLLAAGKTVVYSGEALAFHKHWKDWPAQRRMERAYGIGAGAEFAKYMRCRELYGLQLLALWVWQLGVRRLGSGILKWRSARVMYLGYCQLVYPWLGIAKSLRYRVDQKTITFVDP